jgi:hypothetical protein
MHVGVDLCVSTSGVETEQARKACCFSGPAAALQIQPLLNYWHPIACELPCRPR